MSKKESSRAYGRLVEKAWSDESFKKRLLEDGKGVLVEAGIDVPEGVDIKFHENTGKVVHVVLPSPPSMDGELSHTELDAVAGGDLLIPDHCGSPLEIEGMGGQLDFDPRS
ncbi:MAG: NHLP leader peptide family natural product precursor [Deltaproteobacteria bacterium]|jgi:hypothetical protein|nr:NHLP leader peptide family natural product precursor [Deltaproteobacteria bacterium]